MTKTKLYRSILEMYSDLESTIKTTYSENIYYSQINLKY